MRRNTQQKNQVITVMRRNTKKGNYCEDEKYTKVQILTVFRMSIPSRNFKDVSFTPTGERALCL